MRKLLKKVRKFMGLDLECEFELGDIVKDTVTGFAGMVTARSEFLNGCIRLAVTPTSLDKDGKMQAGERVDIQQLVLVKKKAQPKAAVKKTATGGPRRDAQRRSDAPAR